MSRQHCVICAWRETCAKRFSVADSGAKCPDFSRDVTIKDPDDNKASATNEPSKESVKK